MTPEILNRFVAATACFLATNAPTPTQIYIATKRMQTGFELSEHERKQIFNALCDRFNMPRQKV